MQWLTSDSFSCFYSFGVSSSTGEQISQHLSHRGEEAVALVLEYHHNSFRDPHNDWNYPPHKESYLSSREHRQIWNENDAPALYLTREGLSETAWTWLWDCNRERRKRQKSQKVTVSESALTGGSNFISRKGIRSKENTLFLRRPKSLTHWDRNPFQPQERETKNQYYTLEKNRIHK